MARGERIVVQVAVDDRRTEPLGERLALVDRIGHHHAAAGDDDRKLRAREQLGCFVQALFAARSAVEPLRLRDLGLDLAVEVVARNVQLRRPHFGHRAIETASGEFGHARRVRDVALILGEFLEHRQLLGFLKPAQANAHRAGFRRDDHHRAMRPIRGGNRGDAVADAGAVLADHHAMTAGHPRITVGHMPGALLMHYRNQTNAGGREDIHRVHEGGAHDAEHLGDAVGGEGLDEGFGGGHRLGADEFGGGGGRGGVEFAHGKSPVFE